MITPLDIQNKEFKKSFRGYDMEDVDTFLDDILSDYESIYRENIELKDKLGMLTAQVDKYGELEETLKNTLVIAQSTADDVTKTAREKSRLIIEEAEIRAKEEQWRSDLRLEEVKSEYNNLKKEIAIFKNKYKTFLKSQLASIEEFSYLEGLNDINIKVEDEISSGDAIEETVNNDIKENIEG